MQGKARDSGLHSIERLLPDALRNAKLLAVRSGLAITAVRCSFVPLFFIRRFYSRRCRHRLIGICLVVRSGRTGGRVGIHALLELIITPLLLSFFLCLPLPAFLAHSPDTTLIYCVLWSQVGLTAVIHPFIY